MIADRQLSRDKQLSRSRDQSLDHGLDLRSRQLLAAGRSSNSGLILAHPFPSAAKEGFDGCTYLGERQGCGEVAEVMDALVGSALSRLRGDGCFR